MSTSARLQKVLPALSPLQRAVLVLKAQGAGVEVEPAVRGPLVEGERRVFNRLMGLLYIANVEMRAVLHNIECRVADLDYLRYISEFLVVAAVDLEGQTGEQPPKKLPKDWRRRKDLTPPLFLRGLAEETRQDALSRLLGRWRELAALQLALEELSAEFGGEDVLFPDFRVALEDTHLRLGEAADNLGYKGKDPEPDEDYADELRAEVQRAMQQLRLVEV